MNKKLRLASIVTFSCLFATALSVSLVNRNNIRTEAENVNYNLTLNSANTPTGLVADAFTNTTVSVSGKTLDLEYAEAKKVEGAHVSLDTNGYIKSSHIRELQYVTATFTGELELVTGLIDSDLFTYTLESGVKTEINGYFFKLLNNSSSEVVINSVVFEYTCSSEEGLSVMKDGGALYHNVGFDYQTQTYRLKVAAKDDSGNHFGDTAYLDLGSFPSGGSITLTFKGNKKPQIAFFQSGATKTILKTPISGPVFSDEIMSSPNSYYRIWKTTNVTSGAVLANRAEWNKMFRDNLDSNTVYEMTVTCGYKPGDAKYIFTCNLYSVVDGVKTLVTTGTNPYNSTEFTASGDHVILYGSRIYNAEFQLSYHKNNTHNSTLDYQNGTFYMEKNGDASGNYTDASYIDLGAGFENGAEVTITLDSTVNQNRYFPSVSFFSDRAEASYKSSAIGGFFFHGDNLGDQFKVYNTSGLGTVFVEDKSKTNFASYQSLDKIGASTHVLSMTYKCVKTSGGYVLGFTVNDLTDNKELGTYSKTIGLTDDRIKNSGSHIVIYGSRITQNFGQLSVEVA